MNQNDELDISAEELQKTLINFLGHNYKEVSQFDSRLVSPNSTLSPKKQEFQNIASRVLQEITPTNTGHIPVGNIQHVVPQHHVPQHQYIQPTQNVQPQPQVPVIDPNQLEFDFNNSVTALSIDKRLTDIENLIKKLDIKVTKMLSLLEPDDFTNLKQD
jgi:hypothetical protein